MSEKTSETVPEACPTLSDNVAQLEKIVREKDKEMVAKEEELKRINSNYSTSVKKVRILEKQKKTLVAIVTELEDSKIRKETNREKEVSTEDLLRRGHNHIPEKHLISLKDETAIIGSGSYGTCELMMWKNIKVCVKKIKKRTTKEEVEKEADTLKRLQQSLFVPVLLGINTVTKPFYIVTKFHSATGDTSLTLYKAINNIFVNQRKWVSILHRCALGLESIHELGFIHNDLHLKNVILDRMDGHIHPVIIDFGKACRFSDGRCRVVNNVDAYTKHHPWIAPETITGDYKESTSSDVYGFGYIMLKVNEVAGVKSLEDLVSKCRSNRIKRPNVIALIEKINSILSEFSVK